MLALAANLLVPPFDGPDEHSHFHYARLLAQGKGLPVQTDPERTADTEGFGPPLYYVVPALVLAALDPDRGASIRHIGVLSFRDLAQEAARPGFPPMNPRWVGFGRGNDRNLFAHSPGGPLADDPVRVIHAMRVYSTVLGLATLVALFLLAREVAPRRPGVQVLAVALVAFNPQFLYLSGLLNNDNLVTTCATFALWGTFRLLRKDRAQLRDALVLGACLGIGMLAKPNMLFLCVPIATVLWLRSPGARAFVGRVAVTAAAAVAISSWFYLRNAWLYGGLDFFGWKTRAILHPFFVLRPEHRFHMLTHELPPMLFTTFWGRFGWLTIPLPRVLYVFYGMLSAASLATLFARGGARSPHEASATRLLWVTVLLNVASLVAFNFTFWAEQGRLLFPSIGAFALLVALGLSRAPRAAGAVLAFALLAAAVFVERTVIYPVYFH